MKEEGKTLAFVVHNEWAGAAVRSIRLGEVTFAEFISAWKLGQKIVTTYFSQFLEAPRS
jgi:hypothetical protein